MSLLEYFGCRKQLTGQGWCLWYFDCLLLNRWTIRTSFISGSFCSQLLKPVRIKWSKLLIHKKSISFKDLKYGNTIYRFNLHFIHIIVSVYLCQFDERNCQTCCHECDAVKSEPSTIMLSLDLQINKQKHKNVIRCYIASLTRMYRAYITYLSRNSLSSRLK